MSDKYKELEGTYPVNGDVTPITHKPIDQIDSSDWAMLPTEKLLDQRIALQNRINMAQSMSQGNMVAQMNKGLQYLDALLAQRSTNETHLI